MSTRDKKHTARAKRSDVVPSNQVTLPGTVGTTKAERAIALMAKWAEEGSAEEDRAAYEAVLEEIERARRPSDPPPRS